MTLKRIFDAAQEASQRSSVPLDQGANFAGFKRVADAMGLWLCLKELMPSSIFNSNFRSADGTPISKKPE
jgi:glutamate dehydrogenase/leucine dehydrogenase